MRSRPKWDLLVDLKQNACAAMRDDCRTNGQWPSSLIERMLLLFQERTRRGTAYLIIYQAYIYFDRHDSLDSRDNSLDVSLLTLITTGLVSIQFTLEYSLKVR